MSSSSANDELDHIRDEARSAIDRVRSELDAVEALLIAMRARQRRLSGAFPSYVTGRPSSRARSDVVLVLRTPSKGVARRVPPDRAGE